MHKKTFIHIYKEAKPLYLGSYKEVFMDRKQKIFNRRTRFLCMATGDINSLKRTMFTIFYFFSVLNLLGGFV